MNKGSEIRTTRGALFEFLSIAVSVKTKPWPLTNSNMMYGTLEDSMEGSQPLLPNQLGHKRRSSLMMGRQLQGLTSVRHGPVLQEILMKPRRLERDEINEWSNDPENLPNGNRRSKSFLYTMLNPRSNALQAVTFKWFISLVIVLDLVSYTVSTDPDLTAEQIKRCHKWEGLTSSIFLVEYLFRLLTVSESKKYSDGFSGRLRYAITIPALVDLIATVPFFLELIFGWDLPTLTWVRAFRLLRILKTR